MREHRHRQHRQQQQGPPPEPDARQGKRRGDRQEQRQDHYHRCYEDRIEDLFAEHAGRQHRLVVGKVERLGQVVHLEQRLPVLERGQDGIIERKDGLQDDDRNQGIESHGFQDWWFHERLPSRSIRVAMMKLIVISAMMRKSRVDAADP